MIVADAVHRWETVSKRDRKRGYTSALRTTDEIAGSIHVRHEYNHQVALAGPLQYAEQELPIEPYVFGIWLGDGTSTAAEITTADDEVVANISSAGTTVAKTARTLGYRIGGAGQSRSPTTGRYERNGSLSSRLRDLGVHGRKHIPECFLQASVRRAVHAPPWADGQRRLLRRDRTLRAGRHEPPADPRRRSS